LLDVDFLKKRGMYLFFVVGKNIPENVKFRVTLRSKIKI